MRLKQPVFEHCPWAQKHHLGALAGILSVLHTWTGDLRFHPHVHMLITSGGITPDGEHFQSARGKFLLPVAVLSRKIAAKFHDTLKKQKPDLFATIPEPVWDREWVSFCKVSDPGDATRNAMRLSDEQLHSICLRQSGTGGDQMVFRADGRANTTLEWWPYLLRAESFRTARESYERIRNSVITEASGGLLNSSTRWPV